MGFLCRPDQIGAHALLNTARPIPHAGPWAIPLCGTANAASDDAEALRSTLMGLAPAWPSQRLEQSRQRTAHWKRWGPYLGKRQWGTVRDPPWATHLDILSLDNIPALL